MLTSYGSTVIKQNTNRENTSRQGSINVVLLLAASVAVIAGHVSCDRSSSAGPIVQPASAQPAQGDRRSKASAGQSKVSSPPTSEQGHRRYGKSDDKKPITDVVADWNPVLAQLFAAPVPKLREEWEETAAEALELPLSDKAVKRAISPKLIGQQRDDTIVWVRRILKPEWIDEQALSSWLGIPKAIQGLDALFGGWAIQGRVLQIVVTERRIHFRIRLPEPLPNASNADKIELAAEFASQLFQPDTEWKTVGWQIRSLGGFASSHPNVRFISSWRESCLIVTDGSAVKYSFLKIIKRDSPPASYRPDNRGAWFRQ